MKLFERMGSREEATQDIAITKQNIEYYYLNEVSKEVRPTNTEASTHGTEAIDAIDAIKIKLGKEVS